MSVLKIHVLRKEGGILDVAKVCTIRVLEKLGFIYA